MMSKTFYFFSGFFLALLISPSLIAQDDDRDESDFVFIDPAGKKGFMFGVNLGYYLPNDDPTSFYDGTPKSDGFLDLANYIQLEYIQQQFANELGNSVSNFYLVEYPNEMRYTNTISLGGNVRYQFNWANAIVMDAHYISLKTVDAFVMGYANDNGTSQDIYQNFDIQGKEDRLQLSIGYQVSLAQPTDLAMHFEFGPMMTSIKIKENNFFVGSRSFSILRAQTVGVNNAQILNNAIPNVTSFGAYVQPGFNLEFDKFTLDLDWRTSIEKIQLSDQLEAKYRLNHMPMVRFVYRVSVKGF